MYLFNCFELFGDIISKVATNYLLVNSGLGSLQPKPCLQNPNCLVDFRWMANTCYLHCSYRENDD